MEIKETLDMLKEFQKEPEVYLYFGAEDDFENRKRVKFIPKFSAYTLENMISVIQSQDLNPFVTFINKVKAGTKKALKNEDFFKYIEENPSIYTKDDLLSWIKDSEKFIDKGKLIEEDRVNIETFKLIINKFKDFDGITYSPNEIELINSDWNSDFWKKQDRISIKESSWFFRTKNGIGVKLDKFNF